MMGRILVIFAALALLSACASERVILLPDEDGTASGGLAVLEESGEEKAVLFEPYTEARTGLGGTTEIRRTDAAAVHEDHGTLLADLPAPPSRFILYFKEGTAVLVADSEPELEKLFAEVAARSGADAQVVGHTDTLGAVEDNDRLSQARAEEVRRLLIEQGLDASLVRAVGRGERELLVETDDEVRESENRRVEVIVR